MAAGGYSIRQSVEFGGRVTGITGNTALYNTFVNLNSGPRLFEHIKNGYLKPNDVVTHRIPLAEIGDGYHIFSAKLDGCIKPIVVPNAA